MEFALPCFLLIWGGGCYNKIICTLLLSLLWVRLKYLLLLPTAYMNLRLEQELPVCDSTLTQRDKVCGWTVHTNEFIELLSVLDTTDKSGRDYGSIAISFSSLHKYCWWAGFVYLMQNMRENLEEDNTEQHRSLMTQICSALHMH